LLSRGPIRTRLPGKLCVGLFLAAILVANSRLAQAVIAPQTAGSFRTVNDDTGRTIRVATPVRRIVSLSPSMTEIVYALGLQDQLVGDTDFCDYPPDAAKKHKVGGVINPSLEEIVSLKPDLVLVTSSNRWETVHALERLGIPSYAAEPRTLAEIRALVRHLAVVLGKPEAGDALDSELQQKTDRLQQKLQNVSSARVLFVVWTDPLISIGKNTFISDALTYAGAVSVVDSAQDWPRVSLEEVAHLQPEILIFASDRPETIARDVEALALRPDWNSLDAIKHRRFVVVSEAVNRPAPRFFSAVEQLARQLHPDAFGEKPQPEKSDSAREKN
jgi:iron complex transport system substrate-binding protein